MTTSTVKCEKCSREMDEFAGEPTFRPRRCAVCGRTVCFSCAVHLRPPPQLRRRRTKKYQAELSLLPLYCEDCFARQVLAQGCAVCEPFDVLKTPCYYCPLPLERRETMSDSVISKVHQALTVKHRASQPSLPDIWHAVVRRAWDGTQRGRFLDTKVPDPLSHVQAVKIAVDVLADRLRSLGLEFAYTVTQANLTALTAFKAGRGFLEACDHCSAVARSGATYGWCWSDVTLCPYHVDTIMPERVDNWRDLVAAPIESEIWQAAIRQYGLEAVVAQASAASPTQPQPAVPVTEKESEEATECTTESARPTQLAMDI
jgi:hypothetical protein